MKKIFFALLTLITIVTFIGCKCSKTKIDLNKSNTETYATIKSIVAKNYFFNNGISTPNSSEEFVISSQSEFDKYFSPAAFMGKDGEPTKTDFKKQSALCIVLDETNIDKRLDFIELTSNKDKTVTCNYHLTIGRKLTYTIRPCLIILVDKKDITKGVHFHRVFVR